MKSLTQGRGPGSIGAKVETLQCLCEGDACEGVSGDVMGVARDVI